MYPFQNPGFVPPLNQAPQYRYPSVDRLDFPPIQFGINSPPFVPQIQLDPQLNPYIGLVAYHCAKKIQDEATNPNASAIRIYMYNVTAENRFMNQEFSQLVFDAARFVNYLLYVSKEAYDYETACEIAALRMCAYRAAFRYYNDAYLQQALQGRISDEDQERYRSLKESYDNAQQQFAVMQMPPINQGMQMYPNQMPNQMMPGMAPQQMQGWPQPPVQMAQPMWPGAQPQMQQMGQYPQQMMPQQMQGWPQPQMYPNQMQQMPQYPQQMGYPNQMPIQQFQAPQPPMQMAQPYPNGQTQQSRPWGRNYARDTDDQPIQRNPEPVQETRIQEPIIQEHKAQVGKLYPLDTDLLEWKPSNKQRHRVLHNPLTQEVWLQLQEDGSVLMVLTEIDKMDYDKHRTAKVERWETMIKELEESMEHPKTISVSVSQRHDKDKLKIDFKVAEDLSEKDFTELEETIQSQSEEEAIKQVMVLDRELRDQVDPPKIVDATINLQSIYRDMGEDALGVIETFQNASDMDEVIKLLKSSQIEGRSTEKIGKALDQRLCDTVQHVLENSFGIVGLTISDGKEDWYELGEVIRNKWGKEVYSDFESIFFREYLSGLTLAEPDHYLEILKSEDPFGFKDQDDLIKEGELMPTESIMNWARRIGLVVLSSPFKVYKVNSGKEELLLTAVDKTPYSIFKTTNGYVHALCERMLKTLRSEGVTKPRVQFGFLITKDQSVYKLCSAGDELLISKL